MLKEIYLHLKDKGLNPYFPGQHKGECTEPYVVIKLGAQRPSVQSNKLGQRLMDFIMFVPIADYKRVETYRKDVIEALKELKYLRKTGSETPAIADEDKKAYTFSVEYTILKKLEG